MKKLFLTILSSLVLISGASAQRIVDNPNNRIYSGIRVAYNLSIPTKLETAGLKSEPLKSGSGVSLNYIANFPVVANFFIEPGAEFYYNTQSINFDPLNDKFSHRSLRKFGMRIPVQLGYHFDFTNSFNVSIFTGPVLNVGFSNDYFVTSKEIAGKSAHVSGTLYNDEGLNRVDCAWRIGVGFTFNDLYLGISGDLGMTNLIKKNADGNIKLHENGLMIAVGTNF